MESNELKLRRQILDILSRVFPPSEQTHGLDHAIEVERMSLEIAKEREFSNVPLDMMVLRAVALLHDIGHSKATSSWSSSRVEHVDEGVKTAQEVLTTIPPFDGDEKRRDQVLYLIQRHDETNYSFPIKTQKGKPAQRKKDKRENKEEEDETAKMLAILKEADSRTATGKKGAERTLKYSLSRVPPFASREGNPLNAWMWEESAVGNVRLAAKRALLDAYTRTGKEFAWQGYLEAEEVVKDLCECGGVTYEKELCLELLNKGNIGKRTPGFQICEFTPWGKSVDILREKVSLRGDPDCKPYNSARIQSKLTECKRLAPLAYYVLKQPNLELLRDLRNLFLENYALDPFDLAGRVKFRAPWDDQRRRYIMASPLVEISEPDGGTYALVDGLHRCYLAKNRLRLSKIRVIIISNPPFPRHPLPPLPAYPLRWEEVKEFLDVPPKSRKRKFRFSNPDSSYRLYRTLIEFCSSSIRSRPLQPRVI